MQAQEVHYVERYCIVPAAAVLCPVCMAARMQIAAYLRFERRVLLPLGPDYQIVPKIKNAESISDPRFFYLWQEAYLTLAPPGG